MQPLFSRFKAHIQLLRPPLAAMDLAMPAAAALLAVYAVEGSLPPLLPFIIASIGAYCAITSSYVYNDCCDIDVDSIAMPDRPLPSAQLSRKEAQLWSLFLFMVAAAVALYLNPESFVVLAAATLLITIYSTWAKRNTPFSWIFVGLSFGLVPLGVWLAFEPAGLLKAGPGLHPAGLILAAMIGITDWGFTNCDASRDVAGDKEKGIPTTPATYRDPGHGQDGVRLLDHRRRALPGFGAGSQSGMALSGCGGGGRRMAALAEPGLRAPPHSRAGGEALLPVSQLQSGPLCRFDH